MCMNPTIIKGVSMNIINIGITTHVDVEKVLFSMPSYALKCHFLERSNNDNLLMDSFDLKQEREITIFSKSVPSYMKI